MRNRERLEEQLSQMPLYQYEFISTEELVFSPQVRHICETECPMYGKTWACPPGVGTVEECRQRCLRFPQMLVMVTMTEVEDITNLQETLDTRADHEALTVQVRDLLQQECEEVYVLSTEACSQCRVCSYPDAPCRHPEHMFPCVESHGILLTRLYEKYGLSFFSGNLVTWFSLLLYR